MNILYIAHERKLGGATISLLALIDEMVSHGHSVRVVVPTSKCPLAKELQKRGIEYYACFFAWWMRPKFWNSIIKLIYKTLYWLEPLQVWFVYRRVRRDSFAPDIVHTNSSVTDFGAKIAAKFGCKHIWHVREFGLWDYDLEYAIPEQRAYNYMQSNSSKIVFISNTLLKYFDGKIDSNRQVIYNGVSDKYRIDYSDKSSNRDVVFLVSSNINRNKRQMDVLCATKLLCDEGISDFKVKVAGAPSSMSDSIKYYQEMKEYADDSKLWDRVELLGRVSDMVSLRKNTDVEIVPSSMEAFGRVTVEAFFSSSPVIASDTGANAELVQDGVTGFLYECGNAEDLKEKMKNVITNRNLISTMGRSAYDDATERFTASENARQIELLYRDM